MSFKVKPNLSDIQFKQTEGSKLTMGGITDFVGVLKSKGIEIDCEIVDVSGVTGYVLTFDGNKIKLMEVSDGLYNLSSPTTIAVGGIPKNFNLIGLTSNQILEQLLAPIINPTYVAPSHEFLKSSPASNLFEVGETTNISFTNTFNKGQILLDGEFQNYLSGNPNTYYYNGPSLVLEHVSTMLIDSKTINDYIITIGNQTWNSYVGYDVGPQPLNSRGDNFGTPLPAGETTITQVSIEGVYPIVANINTISVLDKLPLYSMITGNDIDMLLVSEFGGDKQEFAIPNSWLGLRPLVGIMQYNDLTLQWEYPGGTALNSLSFWTTSSITQTIQGNVINYTKYRHNYVDRGSVLLRLVF